MPTTHSLTEKAPKTVKRGGCLQMERTYGDLRQNFQINDGREMRKGWLGRRQTNMVEKR